MPLVPFAAGEDQLALEAPDFVAKGWRLGQLALRDFQHPARAGELAETHIHHAGARQEPGGGGRFFESPHRPIEKRQAAARVSQPFSKNRQVEQVPADAEPPLQRLVQPRGFDQSRFGLRVFPLPQVEQRLRAETARVFFGRGRHQREHLRRLVRATGLHQRETILVIQVALRPPRGLNLERLLIRRQRFRRAAGGRPRCRQVDQGRRITRRNANDLFVFLSRFVEAPQLSQQVAEVMAGDVIGVALQQGAIQRHGFKAVTQVVLVRRLQVPPLTLGRAVGERERALQVLLAQLGLVGHKTEIGLPERGVGHGKVRVELDGPPEVHHRFLIPAACPLQRTVGVLPQGFERSRRNERQRTALRPNRRQRFSEIAAHRIHDEAEGIEDVVRARAPVRYTT